MKIDLFRIPEEGMFLEEELTPGELDLDTELIKVNGRVRVQARVRKSYGGLSVELILSGRFNSFCSRCLQDINLLLDKKARLDISVTPQEQTIDLNPDIREEIILGYPLNPLCKEDCKGLCPKCGKILNSGKCNCD